MNGNAGNDEVIGAAGDDKVSGGDGNDIVIGGEGNDSIGGDIGNDTLLGGSLAEAGLAEMRALIFELRPESLQTEGLVAALGRLVNALGARYQLEVRMEAGGEPDVALEVKESLYRIAQEAMNNIAKHARAGRVEIQLAQENRQLILGISDGGMWFDRTQSFPGHLGLHTMRERAEKVGGTFSVESAPNRGTRIQVRISR